jgi:hypothetical protein
MTLFKNTSAIIFGFITCGIIWYEGTNIFFFLSLFVCCVIFNLEEGEPIVPGPFYLYLLHRNKSKRKFVRKYLGNKYYVLFCNESDWFENRMNEHMEEK